MWGPEHSGSASKVDPTGFADELDMGIEGKIGDKDVFYIFRLNN